jgi:hypothetical protein
MPCCDDYPPVDHSHEISQLRVDNKFLEQALCAALSALKVAAGHVSFDECRTVDPLDMLDYKEAGFKRARLKLWWEKHQADDFKRKQREASAAAKKTAEEQLERERQDALAKLTPKERKLLGLK